MLIAGDFQASLGYNNFGFIEEPLVIDDYPKGEVVND